MIHILNVAFRKDNKNPQYNSIIVFLMSKRQLIFLPILPSIILAISHKVTILLNFSLYSPYIIIIYTASDLADGMLTSHNKIGEFTR